MKQVKAPIHESFRTLFEPLALQVEFNMHKEVYLLILFRAGIVICYGASQTSSNAKSKKQVAMNPGKVHHSLSSVVFQILLPFK